MVNKRRRRPEEIRDFVLHNLEGHPSDITKFTADHFGVTRQAVLRHVRSLESEGLIEIAGTTSDREYKQKPIVHEIFSLDINQDLKEDVIWRDRVRPNLEGLKKNVLSICEYGFTEMFNNVIEHSSARETVISIEIFPTNARILISDNGVGIFNKIQSELNLDDKRHAILELSKGKLTTDPEGHTGEGVFFTSRMFDKYSILSSDLYFAHSEPGDDWLLQDEETNEGTAVFMSISTKSERTPIGVFDKYSVEGSYGFDRTHVPVLLSQFGEENFVSRSQARRLLTRFDRFKEVFLNFKGVETIGQAFADEIFRVFQNENPDIKIIYVNVNSKVRRMIWRAKGIQPTESE